MYPPGYEQYATICRRLGKKPDDRIAKFAARYKFAGQLQSIEILQTSQKSEQAYLAVLRLSLAYSAFETLTKARNTKGSSSVKSAKLAEIYRHARLSKFHQFLIENIDENAAKNAIIKFRESRGDTNLLPVIVATRHLMFHGIVNPTAAGLTTKAAKTFIDDLAKELFKEMNRQMEEHLTAFLKSIKEPRTID